MIHISPTTLSGQQVRLEPLAEIHLPDLADALRDGELWKLFFTAIPHPDELDAWLANALKEQSQGISLPFAIVNIQSGKAVGSTRYCNIAAAHHRMEIGYTWYRKQAQRTGLNTECKYLLLKHAFDTLGCNVVEFRTDWLNHRSQAAIERLGAKRDGVLRNHSLAPDGRIRDIVVYSVIRSEWLGIEQHLRFLQRH